MKLITMTAIAAFGALALAAPASAQLVNGLSGPNYNHDAPIGTKAGGAVSTLKAPGEAAAITGALANERDARNMGRTHQPLLIKSTMFKPASKSVHTQTMARNEAASAKLRLDMNSD
jgi:hypothetical protein